MSGPGKTFVSIQPLFDQEGSRVCYTDKEACHFYEAPRLPDYGAGCSFCERGIPSNQPHRLCPIETGCTERCDAIKDGAASECPAPASFQYRVQAKHRDKMRTLTAAQPMQPARDENIEERAKAIYKTWTGSAGYVPWMDGGNSHMQDAARRFATPDRVAQPAPAALKAARPVQPAPSENFDMWSKNPYTLVLQKSIGEDYVPRSAQPVQPADTALQKAAQAIIDRWNSQKWDWEKQGPTGDLMYEMKRALECDLEVECVAPDAQPVQPASTKYQT